MDELNKSQNPNGVCEHCGQELQLASKERQKISETQIDNITKVSDALDIRNEKLDFDSEKLLSIVQRIESAVNADLETREAIKELELKLRTKIAAEQKKGEFNKQGSRRKSE